MQRTRRNPTLDALHFYIGQSFPLCAEPGRQEPRQVQWCAYTPRRIWCYCCSALSAFTAQQVCLASCPSISLACWPTVYESIPSRSIIYLFEKLYHLYLSVANAIISNLHSLLARWEQLVSWLLHTFGTYPTSISMREIAQQTFFTSISTFDCLKLVTKHFQALRTKPANSPSKTYVVRTAPL